MTARCCSAPRLVKFKSRFTTTVDVVYNLALLAGLLTYLRTFTNVLARAHRLTLAHINNHTFTHSHTHAHLYTQSPLRHTNIHIHSKIQIYSIHTNTCIQYIQLHAHLHTHNTQIHTQIHTFKHALIHACNYTPARTCVLIFSFLKTLTLTLVHTNTRILLTYTTHMISNTHS